MIRLTVTDLDDFRRYREEEEMHLPELLARLRREEPATAKMMAGRALHKVLETTHIGASGAVLTEAAVDGVLFRFDLEAELALPTARELRGARVYIIDGVEVELRGRVDGLAGLTIDDHKLTEQFDAERYHDRYQWRAYLSIFGADVFTYNVFVAKYDGLQTFEVPTKFGDERETVATEVWTIRDLHRLTFYRYPELEADITRELARYVEFARVHLPAQVAA